MSGSKSEQRQDSNPLAPLTRRENFTLASLCFVHIAIHMDRLAVSGAYAEIQQYFGVEENKSRLVLALPLILQVCLALLLGYLGDRYHRLLIIVPCVALTSVCSLVSSFMTVFELLLFMRCLAAVGEAGFTVIAPSLLADIVIVDRTRTSWLACYFIAVPVGSSLGYGVGQLLSFKVWWMGLRVAPALLLFGATLLYFAVNPSQGEKEIMLLGGIPADTTTFAEDLKYMLKNHSFIFTISGFTCACFVHGAMMWWLPLLLQKGFQLSNNNSYSSLMLEEVQLIFFLLTAFSGLIGIISGSLLSRCIRPHISSIDPTICSIGLFLSLPFLVVVFLLPQRNKFIMFVLVFIGQVGLLLNWAIVTDIVLYVVVPTRRATAIALQIMVTHSLGYCGSLYIVDILYNTYADAVGKFPKGSFLFLWRLIDLQDANKQKYSEFLALQMSMLTVLLAQVLGCILFFFSHYHISADRRRE